MVAQLTVSLRARATHPTQDATPARKRQPIQKSRYDGTIDPETRDRRARQQARAQAACRSPAGNGERYVCSASHGRSPPLA
jgi:hypothetical protein